MEPRTINLEPSWITVAQMAVNIIKYGDNDEHGIKMVMDMGYKLALVRAQADDCPDQLKNPENPNPGWEA